MTDMLTVAETGGRKVVDFDHWSPHYRDHWPEMAAAFHAQGPQVAWTEHYGGSWVVAAYDQVREVLSNPDTFTSVNDLDGTENGGKGQVVPQMPYRLFLGESDPPIHTERRRLESPFFTLKAVDRWRPALERHFLEALNEVIESGSADLVDDVTIPTTARTTLFVVGYDPDAWRAPAAVAHKSGYLTPDHPDYPRGEQEKMRREFRDMLTSRVGEPTTDIIAALANGIVEGRPLTLDEGESMMNALIFGGFDTTVSATCSSLIWFDRHRDEREAVFADPRRLNNAVDELLRLYPPVSHQARTAIRDTELLGQPIAAGERVLAWLAAANRDPAKYPDPDVVDLDRANAPTHFSFSGGPHRCLGSPLAKLEIAHMLKRLYELLPDLAIDHDGVERFPTAGGVAGFVRVPATFTPRERVPVPDPSE